MKIKKLLPAAALLVAMGFAANVSAATAYTPLGCYPWENGKLSLSINVPFYLKLKASTQAVISEEDGGLGFQNSYGADKSFYMRITLLDALLGSEPVLLEGAWMQTKGSNYKVSIPMFDTLAAQIAAELDIENPGDVKVNKSFAGSVTKNSLKTVGNFALGVTVVIRGEDPNPDPTIDEGKVLGKASFNISGHFEGARTTLESCVPPTPPASGLAAKTDGVPPGLSAFGQRFIDAVKKAESADAQSTHVLR